MALPPVRIEQNLKLIGHNSLGAGPNESSSGAAPVWWRWDDRLDWLTGHGRVMGSHDLLSGRLRSGGHVKGDGPTISDHRWKRLITMADPVLGTFRMTATMVGTTYRPTRMINMMRGAAPVRFRRRLREKHARTPFSNMSGRHSRGGS
jgi:hypothetical protein